MNIKNLLYHISTTPLCEKYVQEIYYVYYPIKVPGRYAASRIQPTMEETRDDVLKLLPEQSAAVQSHIIGKYIKNGVRHIVPFVL